MADLVPRERLQPSLLDRLVDKHPEKNLESRDEAVLSMADLKRAVKRDLAWLLTARAHTRDEDLYDYKLVAKSVVNFGIPNISGETRSSLRAQHDSLRRGILEAVRTYEPRIASHTLAVNIDPPKEDTPCLETLAIKISGDLWALPSPEWLNIETTLDMDLRRSSIAQYIQEGSLHGDPPAGDADGKTKKKPGASDG